VAAFSARSRTSRWQAASAVSRAMPDQMSDIGEEFLRMGVKRFVDTICVVGGWVCCVWTDRRAGAKALVLNTSAQTCVGGGG